MMPTPPRFAVRLLARALRRDPAGPAILGDLNEDFVRVARAHGLRAARRWYWREALRLAGGRLVPSPLRTLFERPTRAAASIGRSRRRSGHRSFDALLRDVHDAVRTLRRDAAGTAVAVAIAGLGIAAGATVFSVCQAILIRPLPFRDPGQLVWIANGTSEDVAAQTVQVSNLVQLREESRSFAGVAGFFPFYVPGGVRLTGPGEPERVTAVPVTQTFFAVVGVDPLLGRFFDDAESRWGAPMTAVLDYRFWRRRFAGDPDVVGRAMSLDGTPATIVGVLPASFDFAAMFMPGRRADFFVPFALSPETDRSGNVLALIGRLRDDADLAAAQVEASTIGARIVEGRVDDIWRDRFEPRLSTLRQRVSGRFTPALVVLAAAVGFLLLLVCANLSNFLLLRGSFRRREMAVRAALGASRGRLVRQLLVESLLLGGGAAALGLLLATAGTSLISGIEGTTVPLLSDVRVDGVVLGFTALAAVLTSVAVGTLPALQATASAVPAALAVGNRGGGGGRAGWIRRAIVVTEVALGCVLLTGAGLLARSLLRVLDVHPGFAPANLLVMRVDDVDRERTEWYRHDPRATTQTTLEERRQARTAYLHAVAREVATVPGVEVLGLSDALPLGERASWRRWWTSATGLPAEGEQSVLPLVRLIDPGYLAAMRIPLRAGRAFTTADDGSSEPVVIINDLLAAELFPGQDPVGRTLWTSDTAESGRRVVGVVGAVRNFALDRRAEAEMYLPLDQEVLNFGSLDLVVRGTLPPTTLVAGVRAALQRVDPTLPVATFRTMQELVDRSLFPRRFLVLLVTGFAAFGLALFSFGTYAVVAYAVSQRTQEIGIRMALGATAERVRAGILAETAALVLMGLLGGLPLSWLTTQTIRAQLFEVGASDPVTYGVVLAILAGVSALAGFLPARRAARIDPAMALRSS